MADENRDLVFDIPLDCEYVHGSGRLLLPPFALDEVLDGLPDDQLEENEEAHGPCTRAESSEVTAPPGRLTRAKTSEKKKQPSAGALVRENAGRVTRAQVSAAKKNLDPPRTDQLVCAKKKVTAPTAGQKTPLFSDSLAFHKKKLRSPIPPPPIPPSALGSTRVRGVLSTMGKGQLITILAAAYEKHVDIRADVSVRCREVERKLYIHNLPLDMTLDSVESLFAVFGKVEDVGILHSKLDKNTRRGFVLFRYVEDAARAAAKNWKLLSCHLAQEECREEKCLF